MQMCNSTHCISPSTFILSTILGPPWPPRLAMPCSAWGDLHWLTSDPASNSHLSEVLYLRTLKANIGFFSSSYTVKFAGQTHDNIKLCWKQETKKIMELCFCAINKNQQKEGCQCGIKAEKLCAFCAVDVSVMHFMALHWKKRLRYTHLWHGLLLVPKTCQPFPNSAYWKLWQCFHANYSAAKRGHLLLWHTLFASHWQDPNSADCLLWRGSEEQNTRVRKSVLLSDLLCA